MVALAACLSKMIVDPPVVAVYLPAWGMAGYSLLRLKPATDVLYFSIQPRSDGTLNLSDISLADIPRLVRAKAKYGFRLELCCGGWERSAGFYPMARNDTRRARFVEAAYAFCQSNGFDGIDLDWEHPQNQAEANAYGKLIHQLQTKFSSSGMIVTAAIADWEPMSAEGISHLDRVHLMSYDHDGKHSTLEDAESDVQALLDEGFEPHRIILGVPFYGRSLSNWNTEKSYADIVAEFHPTASQNEAGGYYFNGRGMMRDKAALVTEDGLGGMMAWEATQDVNGPTSLLKTIQSALGSP